VADVLIIDDEEALRRSTERLLGGWGYSYRGAADGASARELLQKESYSVALLDINMPGESGIDLLAHIRSHHPATAVVMLTGQDDPRLATHAIEIGAYGYLVKPAKATELLVGVANALLRRGLEADTRRAMERLQTKVEERTGELLEALHNLERTETTVLASRTEAVMKLARVVEFRDEDTWKHVDRMSHLCGLLAMRLEVPDDRCEVLQLASQLHDIGKVAVPDAVLLKPGKLTPEEFTVIQGHAEAGHQMLSDSESDLLQLGAIIAWTHHERWDGRGYPRGLSAEQIPLEGRIAAVADVYDALTSHRVYRPAFATVTAVEMMDADAGTHFDPKVLDAFHAAAADIDKLQDSYGTDA
jgi:putative two-component system response regulator